MDQPKAVAQLEQPTQKSVATQKTLQNATLTANQQTDIEIIKDALIKGYNENDIAEILNCHRTTISRKIAKWMQTPDFDEWIDTFWLNLGIKLSLDEDTRVEVFKQLTRLKCAKQIKKVDVKSEVTEIIRAEINVNATILKQYDLLFQERTRTGSSESSIQPVHNPE